MSDRAPAYEIATMAKWRELRPGEDITQLSRLLAANGAMAALVQIAFEAGRDWQSKHPGASTGFPDYEAPVDAAVEVKPGTHMSDGTIYAGISPDTGKPIYTTPADAPLACTFNEAGKYAAKLVAHGHKDWRVPTRSELDVLFNNRAAIGGFDETDSESRSWYWSSTVNLLNLYPFGQRFGNGLQYVNSEDKDLSLRCVRG